MPNIEPLRREDLPEFESLFVAVESAFGFVPNSYFTMGHRPEILRAFSRLAAEVLSPAGTVPAPLKQLVALVASASSGCRYCQAHTAASAGRMGVEPDKVASVFDFESNSQFSQAERAALRLARDAAIVPNASTLDHFVALKQHFNDAQVVELVSVVSLFGWLNRWNDTMATELEDEPLEFANAHLANVGWQPGKHGS
jgi:uncharacterized peroxidase-related enzyme